MLLALLVAPNAASPAAWPRPKFSSSGTASLAVTPTPFFFALTPEVHSPLLSTTFARYLSLTFPHELDDPSGTPSSLTGLNFSVADMDESHPQLATDESYTLSLPSEGGTGLVTAKTVYGALRAIETFSQMVLYDFDSAGYVVPGAPWDIKDAPRFPHRGLMVDSARHYQPLGSLRRLIDGLPFAKINVLHWHMVDSQSFPFEVKSYPKLWSAAYAPSQRYTQADVASIVEYARVRGVRVIVEFDMPGILPPCPCTAPESCLARAVAQCFTIQALSLSAHLHVCVHLTLTLTRPRAVLVQRIS